jgi:hypothetical protein
MYSTFYIFAHAVVDVAGASVSGFLFTFLVVFVLRLSLCYVIY